MAKEDLLRITGKIIEVLPGTLFRVELENGVTILGHLAGKLRQNNVNILLNDTVDVEMSVYDVSRGRIVWRHKRIKAK